MLFVLISLWNVFLNIIDTIFETTFWYTKAIIKNQKLKENRKQINDEITNKKTHYIDIYVDLA